LFEKIVCREKRINAFSINPGMDGISASSYLNHGYIDNPERTLRRRKSNPNCRLPANSGP
jgi:hypothetical protein